MKEVVDSQRRCGWRTPGKLYLEAEKLVQPCSRLPVPLTVCPCCGGGIKRSPGFVWITNEVLIQETCPQNPECQGCVFSADTIPKKLGLLWVGARFYPDPHSFIKEANAQGVSKPIAQIPHDLVLGETVVLLAHPKVTIKRPELGDDPLECEGRAIFSAFIPTRIDYVVKGDETDEELDALVKRGATPVKVEKEETKPLPLPTS